MITWFLRRRAWVLFERFPDKVRQRSRLLIIHKAMLLRHFVAHGFGPCAQGVSHLAGIGDVCTEDPRLSG
jgi:hypothetical protein